MIAKRKGRMPRKKAQVPFVHKLVLNQWLLSLFNVKRFEELALPCTQKKDWTMGVLRFM